MNGITLEFANISTPVPLSSSDWLNFSEEERINLKYFHKTIDIRYDMVYNGCSN